MRGTSVRVSPKWLMAEWPPAGENPADEKDLRTRGQSGGKVGWRLVLEAPTFLQTDLTRRVNPAVSAQCEKKKERPRTPTRERCERATLATTDLS